MLKLRLEKEEDTKAVLSLHKAAEKFYLSVTLPGEERYNILWIDDDGVIQINDVWISETKNNLEEFGFQFDGMFFKTEK